MHEQAASIARIQKDLTDMYRRDSEMRKLEEWDDSIIKENTKKLQGIVDEIGWPTSSLIGNEAAKQAWSIVQHVMPHSIFHAY